MDPNRIYSSPDAESAVGLKHAYRLSASTADPLLVLVHGRAGNVDVMWTFTRDLPEALSIVSFEAPLPDPVGGCSWWLIEDQTPLKDKGEAASSRLAFAIREFILLNNLNPSQILCAGFSQGGAVLSVLGQSGEVAINSVAILAGMVVRVERAGDTLPNFLMIHGTKDDVVPIGKAHEGRDFLLEQGAHVEYFEEEVGHKLGVQGGKVLKAWIRAQMGQPGTA